MPLYPSRSVLTDQFSLANATTPRIGRPDAEEMAAQAFRARRELHAALEGEDS